MRLLLDSGADKDLANNNARTALMLASRIGRLEVVRVLLEYGADKDLAGNHGRTALMHASQAAHWEVVRLLRG